MIQFRVETRQGKYTYNVAPSMLRVWLLSKLSANDYLAAMQKNMSNAELIDVLRKYCVSFKIVAV